MNAAMNLCAACYHRADQHIYEEGACRPGHVCPDGCEQFVSIGAARAASKMEGTNPQFIIMDEMSHTDPLVNEIARAVLARTPGNYVSQVIAQAYEDADRTARVVREFIANEVRQIGDDWDRGADCKGGPYEYGVAARLIATHIVRGGFDDD
jgi:hypothetical protein